MAKLKRKLKKTRIGTGKEIVPWVERLNYFNDYFRPEGYITQTEIQISNDPSIIVMRGMVIKDDVCVADGIAHKKISEPFAYQKCQSGALNRALFIFGIVESDEKTIMDEDEAKELQSVTERSIQDIYNDMLTYVNVDHKIVEERIPHYKNQFTSEQISELRKVINKKKSKIAITKAKK